MDKNFVIILILILPIWVVDADDCRIIGCPPDYRCIANGECTTLSVREYCETHGIPLYIYNDSLLTRNCTKELILEEQKLCQQCQGDYELRKTVWDVENIIYSTAGGIAALMLIINGIFLMISEDIQTRDNAKKAILYVIIGLIIIIIAVKFVEYLIG